MWYCHNQDCELCGVPVEAKGRAPECNKCEELLFSEPPEDCPKKRRATRPKSRKARPVRRRGQSKPVNKLKRKAEDPPKVEDDTSSSDDEEEDEFSDQKKQKKAATTTTSPKRVHLSVARGAKNTAKGGFRLGVVTWNTHGLQKPNDVSNEDALDFLSHLKFVSKWVRRGYELEALADTLWKRRRPKMPSPNPEQRLRDYYAVFEDFERELAEQRHFTYLRELVARYEQLSGEQLNAVLDKPDDPGDTSQKSIALYERCDDLADKLRDDYAAFDDELHECIRTLLRRVSCLAIEKMFELHEWLDALVLQEVKYTGIQMLEYALGGKLFVHPGPMLSSGRGKKREIEYFPIVMRKGGKSIHHPYKLSLKKVWWITTEGETETMSLGDKHYLPNGTPHMTWDKSKNTFRPVVVYDVKIGTVQSAPIVHIGVVHTTPGPRTVELTPAEKRSIRLLTGSQRKKDVASHEFQRPHQFMQVENAFKNVARYAYKQNKQRPEYFGPWILAGDYYLFRESRVIDIETKFEDDSFVDFDEDIDDEVAARIEAYGQCGGNAAGFRQQAQNWLTYLRLWDRRARISAAKIKEIVDTLREEDCVLATMAVSGDPVTRSRVLVHRRAWLLPFEDYEDIDNDTLADVLTWRVEMFNDLAGSSEFYAERYEAISAVAKSDMKTKFNALREDNQAMMKRAGAPTGKSGKTAYTLHMSGMDDPMRAPLSMTFGQQVGEDIQIAQSVSGTNLDKYEELSKLSAKDDEDDFVSRYAEFVEARSRYTARLKIADFLVHTRYNESSNIGATHWTSCTLGMLSPDNGKILLADTDELTISRFWAGFSDHFPIGGVLSTKVSEDEVEKVRELILRQDPAAVKFVEEIEIQRRRERLRFLQRIAKVYDWGDSEKFDGQMRRLANEDPDKMNRKKLGSSILALENKLKVAESDRFSQGDEELTIDPTDVGWSGELGFGALALDAEDEQL